MQYLSGIGLCILFFSWTAALHAQYLSFTAEERTQFLAIIASDSAARRISGEIKKKADHALRQKPDPIATISTAGRLKGDSIRERTIRSVRDFDRILNLSLCYTITSDPLYLTKSMEYLHAWAIMNKASGEPINETKLEPLLEGYDMIRDRISSKDRNLVDGWLKAIANAEMNSENLSILTRPNNFQSHRIKIVGLIGFVLKDEAYISYAEKGLKEQIAKNLNPDGSSYDFRERDALHYHCYTIDPLLRLAIAFRRYGKDYFNYISPEGTSLKCAVDFLLPYVSGKKEHAEYVHSRVSFDRKRSDNGQADYRTGRTFDRKEGIGTLELAVYFDKGYSSYIHGFYMLYGRYPNLRILLHHRY